MIRNRFFASIWRVGVIDKPIHQVRSRDFTDVHWIEPQEFLTCMADPFGFTCKDKKYIICEQFNQRLKQGSIVAMEYIGKGNIVNSSMIFKNANHMSYPYIVTCNNSVYLLKEDKNQKDIELYRMNGTEIVKKVTLVKNFKAVDPSLISFNGKWWLFCTNGDSLECEFLYIFYSDNLESDWMAHSKNPVKRDISSARPAGTPFVHEGNLYRPGQDNNREYGKRIVVNKVIEISPDQFKEEPAYYIEADNAKIYCNGTHTISEFGNMTLVDAKLRISKRKLKLRNKT